MKNKNLIGVSGYIGSGKDEVGKIINSFSKDKYEIKKFADKLKDIVCMLLGCTREQLEDRDFKEKELGEEWWKIFNGSFQYAYISGKHRLERGYDVGEKLTPRRLLQLLGTDAARNIVHPNIWVTSLFVDYKWDKEYWKTIEGYEGSYEISSFGKVRSLNRNIEYGANKGDYHSRKGQILKPTLSGGYNTVSLSGKTFTVHSLVAKHFLDGFKEGFVVNHIDYNKTNNFYKNLEWVTQSDNILHNKKTLRGGFGESQKDAKLNSEKVIAIRKLLEDNTLSQKQISNLFEVSPTTITDIKKGRKWSHVGKEIVIIEPIVPIIKPSWIITDTRFPNELEAIKSRGGITIRVNRYPNKIYVSRGANNTKEIDFDSTNPMHMSHYLGDIRNKHESETALDKEEFDYVIDNNGTLEELKEKVKEILIKEGIL